MADFQIFSAESMTEGQPDKLCDLISDRILDAVLGMDQFARVAVDALAAPGLVLVSGQITTKGYVDITGIVRGTLMDVGYNDRVCRFNADSIAVLSVVEEQSADVAMVVDKKGAGNQGIVVGYATNEGQKAGIDTEYMPIPIWLAQRLSKKLTDVRKTEPGQLLRPDGHAQVTLVYEHDVPARLYNVTVSNLHEKKQDLEEVRRVVMEHVIQPVVNEFPQLHDERMKLRVNPGGPFTLGGPLADIGLTGRKVVSEAYGTACPHGGSALCGKDPTKTDRSAAYMARYVCKNVVAAGIADRMELRLAYLFGVEEPISVQVQTFGTGKISNHKIVEIIKEKFYFTTAGITETLDLRKVKYAPCACYGSFGRSDLDLPWEKLDMVEKLKVAL